MVTISMMTNVLLLCLQFKEPKLREAPMYVLFFFDVKKDILLTEATVRALVICAHPRLVHNLQPSPILHIQVCFKGPRLTNGVPFITYLLHIRRAVRARYFRIERTLYVRCLGSILVRQALHAKTIKTDFFSP